MSVQTYRSHLWVLSEEVLNDKNDCHVAMMTSFREQFGNPTVSLAHQVVNNYQVPLFRIEDIRVRQALDKLNVSKGVKNVLVFAITPIDVILGMIKHVLNIAQQLNRPLRFTTRGRTTHNHSARMLKPHVHHVARP